jgi:hypothetical protein
MKLELEPQPIRLELAAELGASSPSRVVGGLIVPYGAVANVGGRVVEFESGSVRARENGPPCLPTTGSADRDNGHEAQGDAGLGSSSRSTYARTGISRSPKFARSAAASGKRWM